MEVYRPGPGALDDLPCLDVSFLVECEEWTTGSKRKRAVKREWVCYSIAPELALNILSSLKDGPLIHFRRASKTCRDLANRAAMDRGKTGSTLELRWIDAVQSLKLFKSYYNQLYDSMIRACSSDDKTYKAHPIVCKTCTTGYNHRCVNGHVFGDVKRWSGIIGKDVINRSDIRLLSWLETHRIVRFDDELFRIMVTVNDPGTIRWFIESIVPRRRYDNSGYWNWMFIAAHRGHVELVQGMFRRSLGFTRESRTPRELWRSITERICAIMISKMTVQHDQILEFMHGDCVTEWPCYSPYMQRNSDFCTWAITHRYGVIEAFHAMFARFGQSWL